MNSKAIYFPGLNGLRAISALAVVISHITQQLKDYGLNPYIFGTLPNGDPTGLLLADYGVTIFFVISGFLITYLLQAESDEQPIDIKKFYWRRILRIWPLYYFYLIVFIIIMLLFGVYMNKKSLLLYFFFAANIPVILRIQMPFIAHYWSLGVEEQFYLFWPWFNKKVNRYLAPIITVFIVGIVGTKLCLHYFFPVKFIYPGVLLETAIQVTRFHCMLIGALGAILYKQNNQLFFKIVDNKFAQAICWAVLAIAAINKFNIDAAINNEIIAIVALVLIIGQVRVKNRLVNLELKGFDFLGKISYGIYVYHPLLVFLFYKMLGGFDIPALPKYVLVYGLVIAATILIAHLSYNYFEKFFLNLKKKFTVVKSVAAKNLIP